MYTFTWNPYHSYLYTYTYATTQYIASATQSLLMRAENCIGTGGGHFKQLL